MTTTKKEADVVIKAGLQAMFERGIDRQKGALSVAKQRYAFAKRAANSKNYIGGGYGGFASLNKDPIEAWQVDAYNALPREFQTFLDPVSGSDIDEAIKAALLKMAERGDPKPTGALLESNESLHGQVVTTKAELEANFDAMTDEDHIAMEQRIFALIRNGMFEITDNTIEGYLVWSLRWLSQTVGVPSNLAKASNRLSPPGFIYLSNTPIGPVH